MRKAFLWVASGLGLFWLLLTWACLLLAEFTGLFRLSDLTIWQALQSYPSRALAVCCSLSALGILMRIMMSGSKARRLYWAGQVIYLASVIILCASLWVSAYTHFEGDFIRSKGETFNAFPSEYLQQTMFFSSKRSLPQVGMTFTDIRPSGSVARLHKVEADVLYAGRTTDGILEGMLSSSKYFISDWTLARIVDFGYAVRFSLMGLDERELESTILPLKTYPPGTEDKFEATFPGYQFYVQVYTDYIEQGGKFSSKTIYLNNPAIRLRITRNKDIVYEGVLTSGKKLRFDNLVIAFPDLTYWVEVRMLRDLGLPFAITGGFLMFTGLILQVLGHRRNTSRTQIQL